LDRLNKILENLNDQQKVAVKSTEGYVRVIAGAGSGKTKALTSRYAYIVEELGISSSNILCVTFTNKAAQVMKNRVKKLIGHNSDLSYITTYHGFCVRVLREDINKIQYPKTFVIMDVEDQKTILRQIFNELNLSQKEHTFKHVLRFISKQKNSLEYLDYILEQKTKKSNSELEKIFHAYLFKQQKNFALDFDDLINFTIYIFSSFSDILEKWQDRLHYIQVDEAQDSSKKQYNLVSLLSERHKNLFMVGDPDQTIYEWRGARPEFLVDFNKLFPSCKTIILNQNYRSTPEILNLANQIIKKNKVRVDKDLFTKNPNGIKVVHFHAKNDIEESQWIVNEIREIKEVENVNLSDFAILYRAHHVSRNIEQSLISENIPYVVFGGIRFFERKEIKDVLAYLRLISLEDDMSFLRIINYPKRGLGKKYIEGIVNIANNNNKNLLTTLAENIDNKSINREGAKNFINLINEFKEFAKTKSLSDLVKYILDKSEISKELKTDGDEERLENIQELVNSIIYLEKENDEKLELVDYLQEIALYTNKDVIEEDEGRVNLMTIHTAKGLEYPYVFLCGFSDGILPSAMSIKERRKRAIEEERRLTYVAITRAEKSFYLTEAEGFNFRTGEQRYPSRFLFDLNESLYIQKGDINKMYFREAKHHMAFENNSLEEKEIFNIGDFVIHPLWKYGEIKEVNNDKGEYSIYFHESEELKPINFEYTKLKKENDLEIINNIKSGSEKKPKKEQEELILEEENVEEIEQEINTNTSDMISDKINANDIMQIIREHLENDEDIEPVLEKKSENKGFWIRLKNKLTRK
jgi:DNA helicase-2/ATP-dependent DNA helicase PcrA